MVSQIFSVAAFAGMALAQYSNSTMNSTAAAGTAVSSGSRMPSGTAVSSMPSATGESNTTRADEAAFCREFSGQSNKGYEVGDIIYSIACGTGCTGVEIVIDITINLGKRAVEAPAGLPDCINYCNLLTEDAANGVGERCVATEFFSATSTCAFFSSLNSVFASGNTDLAIVNADGTTTGSNNNNGLAGSAVPLTTSVVAASTVTYTIYSCAATVTDCPYAQVATSVVAAYTTVCPGNAAATALAAPVACTNCPYAAKVVTVYSATTNAGTTSYVAVDTQVMNIASPTTAAPGANSIATTVAVAAGATSGVATYGNSGATATQSGVTAYTGAAVHVEAGMGMAAILGAAALLI